MSIQRKLTSVLAFLFVFVVMVIFMSAPERYASVLLNGISLWAVCVLPAIFPFLFLTGLLVSMRPYSVLSQKCSPLTQKIFRISGTGGGLALLSSLSGYPVGARMLADLFQRELIGEQEIFPLLCLCSTSGPIFLVGTVGSMMFQNSSAGWIMLIAHLLAVWSVCFFMQRFKKTDRSSFTLFKPPAAPLSDTLWNAIVSVLSVGAFIALFACLSEMLADLKIFYLLTAPFPSPYAEGVLRGILEMTNGCAFLSAYPTSLSICLCAGIVTFGGACVLMQQLALLKSIPFSRAKFILIKAIQAVVACMIALLLSLLI